MASAQPPALGVAASSISTASTFRFATLAAATRLLCLKYATYLLLTTAAAYDMPYGMHKLLYHTRPSDIAGDWTITPDQDNMEAYGTAQDQMNMFWSTESQDPAAVAVCAALNQNAHDAWYRVATHGMRIVSPATKNMARFAKYFSPNSTCNPDTAFVCMQNSNSRSMSMHSVIDHGSMSRNQCITDAGCQPIYTSMNHTQVHALGQKFETTDNNMQSAMNELGGEIGDELNTAVNANMANVQSVGQAWANSAATILTDYGCNGTCMQACATDWTTFDQCQMGCDCPAVITFSHTQGTQPADSIGIPPMF